MRKIILVLFLLLAAHPAFAAEKESAYDRVIRTGTIRCGYVVYPPIFMKDVNTGKYSGIMYDIMEKVGQKLNLKIDWAEEVNYGSMYEGLKTNRYDMLCINGWDLAVNAKNVAQARPLFYSVVNAFVREGDHRFDNNLAAVNNPAIKVSSIDGTLPSIMAHEKFPAAQKLDLPQNTDYSTILLNVAQGKADISFVENAAAVQFMAHNPGKIRMVTMSAPLQYYSNSFLIPLGQPDLLSMINMVLDELLGGGYIDNEIEKYEKTSPPTFLPVAKPYGLVK